MPDVYDKHLVEQYDQHSFVWSLYVPIVREMLERHRDAALLDLGCGTGSMILTLSESFSSAVGVDLSVAMINRAVQKAKSDRTETVRFEVDDIRRFNPSPGYDVVTSTDGVLPYLQNIEELSDILAMVSRALKPDGEALLEVWTPAANPEPVHGSRTLAPDSMLIPDELSEIEFIRESNSVPEADFARHRYYLPGRPYSYTVMKHGGNEVLHRHRYFSVSEEVLPLLGRHRLRVHSQFGIGANGTVPELQPYSPGSAIWAGVIHK